jgi:hypothetical protein
MARGIERRTHEEVVGVRVWPTDLEQLHQIVKLSVYISADCDGAFLRNCQWICEEYIARSVPLVERLTPPARLHGPIVRLCQYIALYETTRPRSTVAYLLAQPLDVALSQLLAAHEALNPAIQGGDCRRLRSRNG